MAQGIDLVCGMTVETANAAHTANYRGETFYFCAPGCKKAFEKDPSSYVQQSQAEQTAEQSSCSCCHPQQ